MNKNLIIIPTYNEILNIENLIIKISKIQKNCDLLIIDDNSPDGTFKIVKKYQIKRKNIFLIVRKFKNGIGSAHKVGLKWGYKKRYNRIITMDADGTHNPKYIPKLLRTSKKADLVITNRFLKKKSIDTWPLLRIIITNIRHLLIKSLLGVPYDASGAYRCYDPSKVKIKDIIKAEDNSYSFFWESLFIFHLKKYVIKEIPVTLHRRYLGSSKMTLLDILKALLYLLKIFIKK
jgi:dolichol-phosphate mannosyltransferase